MSDLLTREIILRVLADIGVFDISNRQTWAGLCEPEMKSSKNIKIQYDSEVILHDVYCGKLVLNDFYMNGLFVDLGVTVNNKPINEILFLFQAKDKPIHAVYFSEDMAFVKIYNTINDKAAMWKIATIQLQSMMLSGFEQLCSLGVLWQPNNDVEPLYATAVNLISNLES
jgi:hypothetical protein